MGCASAPRSGVSAGRLGHVHGFIGCRSDGQGAGARLVPDSDAFRGLFRLLEGWRL